MPTDEDSLLRRERGKLPPSLWVIVATTTALFIISRLDLGLVSLIARVVMVPLAIIVVIRTLNLVNKSR